MLRTCLNQSEMNLNANTLQTGLNFGARHVHKDNGEPVEYILNLSPTLQFDFVPTSRKHAAEVFRSRFAGDGLGWLTRLVNCAQRQVYI